MRIAIVGLPFERARLRAALNGTAIEIVGEFASVADARAAGAAADAMLVAADASPLEPARRRDPRVDFVEPLTAREIQVLELLAEGLPNKAIAGRLGISDQTVKFHVSSISSKL